MPGLSSRNPVSGYGNIGKVHIRFKPKPKKKPYYGVVLFLFCLLLLIFSWMWTDKWKREVFVLPAFRFILGCIDRYRMAGGPQTSPSSPLPDDIIVDVDALGLPVISAGSLNDVLFGQGYVHAKYRMFQMDLSRHKALGLLSSWEGERGLESDMMARALNISGLASRDLSAQSNVELGYLQSFADGVNAYLKGRPSLPIEYSLLRIDDVSAWTPLDSLAILRYYSVVSNEVWEVELSRYLVERAPDSDGLVDLLVPPLPDAEAAQFGGAVVLPSVSLSSSWVMTSSVEGARPLHSTSIVSEPTAPNMYFDNALHVENVLDVTGACVPGVPMVWMGRNKDVSWSFTPAAVDTQDLFTEQLREEDHDSDVVDAEASASLYYLNSLSTGLGEDIAPSQEVWEEVHTEQEEFVVIDRKSSADLGNPEVRVVPIHYTTRGPLILPYLTSTSGKFLHEIGLQLSLSSAADYGVFHMSGLVQMNTAATWEDFSVGLRGLESTSLNVLYSDTAGTIASTITGRLPVRAEGHVGDRVSEGSLSGWVGSVSALDCENCVTVRFRSLRPEGGVVVSLPWFKMNNSTLLSELSNLKLTASQSAGALSVGNAVAVDCGGHSDSLNSLQQIILQSLTGASTTDDTVHELLQSENPSMHLSGIRRVFLEAFRIEAASGLLRPLRASADIFYGQSHSPWKLSNVHSGYFKWVERVLFDSASPDSNLGKWMMRAGGRDSVIAISISRALEWTKEQTFSWVTDFSWKNFHSIRFAHHFQNMVYTGEILSPGPVDADSGAWDAVRQTGTTSAPLKFARHGMGCGLLRWGADGRCRLETYRSVYSLSSLSESFSLSPPGPTERPGSPYYNSMLDLWRKCELGPAAWNGKGDQIHSTFTVPTSRESCRDLNAGSEL